MFGFLLPPLASHAIAGFGWRTAYLALGLLLLAALPPIALLLVDRPEQRGLRPDGDESATTENAEPDITEWSARAVLGHRSFWPIVLPTGFCLAVSATLLTNLVPWAIDAGIDPQRAAYLASLVALSAAFGKVGFGFVADAISQRGMIWIPSSMLVGTCALLLGDAGYSRLVGAATLLGLAFGAATPAWGVLVGEFWALRIQPGNGADDTRGCAFLLPQRSTIAQVITTTPG